MYLFTEENFPVPSRWRCWRPCFVRGNQEFTRLLVTAIPVLLLALLGAVRHAFTCCAPFQLWGGFPAWKTAALFEGEYWSDRGFRACRWVPCIAFNLHSRELSSIWMEWIIRNDTRRDEQMEDDKERVGPKRGSFVKSTVTCFCMYI